MMNNTPDRAPNPYAAPRTEIVTQHDDWEGDPEDVIRRRMYSRAERGVKAVGLLYLCLGVPSGLITWMALLFLFYIYIKRITEIHIYDVAGRLVFGTVFYLILLLLGYGLRKLRAWSRALGIVFACATGVGPPFFLAIGIMRREVRPSTLFVYFLWWAILVGPLVLAVSTRKSRFLFTPEYEELIDRTRRRQGDPGEGHARGSSDPSG